MLENWDGLDVFRDSFNHYSFGAVCQFLFEYVAGIRPTFEAPGFDKIILKPVVGGNLKFAKAFYKSKRGLICSQWEIKNEKFKYQCRVPENSTACLCLPDNTIHKLKAGKYHFEIDWRE